MQDDETDASVCVYTAVFEGAVMGICYWAVACQ